MSDVQNQIHAQLSKTGKKRGNIAVSEKADVLEVGHGINLLQKRARAQVIKSYLTAIGRESCVCYTCGNAGEALRRTGLQVRVITKPPRWYTFAEIQGLHHRFDATSGHLPAALMAETARALHKLLELDDLLLRFVEKAVMQGKVIALPTGSGETLVTLKMIYPSLRIIPVYNLDESTRYNAKAPLNVLVRALADGGIVWGQ